MKKTIGDRIKRVVNVFCIIMTFFCIAVGIVTYSYGMESGIPITQCIGVVIIPIGFLVFCSLNLIANGFAEMVDNTQKIAETTKQTNEELKADMEQMQKEIKKLRIALDENQEEL